MAEESKKAPNAKEMLKPMEPGSSENPFQLAPQSKKMITLIGFFLCVFGSNLQSGTLSTLLPVAAQEIGGLDYYSLANTVTGIVSVAVMPLWGYLGARSPQIKRPLFAASVWAGAACVFIRQFANSMMVIIAASVLWGFVSAAVFVLGFTMIRDMFDAKAAGKWLGINSTIMLVSILVGPIIGGLVMDVTSWRLVCTIIWPFELVGGLLVFFGVKANKEQCSHLATANGTFDLAGTLTVVVFLTCLIGALSLGTSFIPFGSMLSNLLFVIAAASLVVLVLIIRRKQADAIIPAPALKNRNVLMLSVANFATMFSHMAIYFFMPTYCIMVMGATATEAGLTITLLAVAGIFLSPVFGNIIGKSGTVKAVLGGGSALRIVVGVLFLVFITPETNIIVAYVLMLLASVYNATQSISFSAGPQVMLPAELRVQGNAVIQVGQNLGGAVGTAVYTMFIGLFEVAGGFPVAIGVSIAFAGVALACALLTKKLPAAEETVTVS